MALIDNLSPVDKMVLGGIKKKMQAHGILAVLISINIDNELEIDGYTEPVKILKLSEVNNLVKEIEQLRKIPDAIKKLDNQIEQLENGNIDRTTTDTNTNTGNPASGVDIG